MKVKAILLQQYLQDKKMTVAELAQEIEVNTTELEKLLNGEAVDEKTAHRFIYYFGADMAQEFIDWEAIGKKNPFIKKED